MKLKKLSLLAVSTFAVLLCFSTTSALAKSAVGREGKVKLVLQITIDQLRGDLPLRFKDKFGKGGFRYLFKKGAYYHNAHYIHADTETAPGHATLVTGGTPLQHGITNSEWWDYSKNKIVYSVEDSRYPLLGGKNVLSTAGTSTKEKGRAPTNLLSTTIGDEIYLGSEGKAKILAIAGKDRAAIIPGGRAGKAYWLSQGKFVSSTYYGKTLPEWVKKWNALKIADTYRDKSWQLLNPRDTYFRKDIDDRSFEGHFLHLGKTMPKKFSAKTDKNFYKALGRSPVNDSLVLSFTKYAMDELGIGKGEATDYLSVSFSSTDLVGHTWGPGSLEAEDNLMRVDKNIAALLKYVDKKVGLNKTLIVLSADHGVSELADSITEIGFPAKRIPSKVFAQYIDKKLQEKFSVKQSLVKRFVNPYLFLDIEKLKKLDLDLEDVEEAAAKFAMNYPGITYAVSRSDIIEGELPSSASFYGQIRANFNPKRSGHVHVVAGQYVMFGKKKSNEPGAHGSVWPYDTYVPVVIAGPGIKPGNYFRRVGPHDIAPTIAAYIGIKTPSGSVGEVLLEALDN